MERRKDYLTEEELEKLILDVENQGMLSCPSYLRGEILQRTEVSLQKRKLQYYAYSIKVCVAAAAAIWFLFTVPIGNMLTPQTVAAREQVSFTDKLNRQTSVVCESLNDFSDMLILREKQED